MDLRIVLVAGLSAAAAAGVFGALPDPLRVPLTLPFLAVAPGLAWFGRFGDMEVAALAAVAIAASLAMAIGIGTLLLICGWWAPKVGFGALLAVTLVGLLCGEMARRRAPRRDDREEPAGPGRADDTEVRRDRGAPSSAPRASEFDLRAER